MAIKPSGDSAVTRSSCGWTLDFRNLTPWCAVRSTAPWVALSTSSYIPPPSGSNNSPRPVGARPTPKHCGSCSNSIRTPAPRSPRRFAALPEHKWFGRVRVDAGWLSDPLALHGTLQSCGRFHRFVGVPIDLSDIHWGCAAGRVCVLPRCGTATRRHWTNRCTLTTQLVLRIVLGLKDARRGNAKLLPRRRAAGEVLQVADRAAVVELFGRSRS